MIYYKFDRTSTLTNNNIFNRFFPFFHLFYTSSGNVSQVSLKLYVLGFLTSVFEKFYYLLFENIH